MIRPPQAGDWTPEEISLLTALWPHMTATQITRRIPRTRNAIIGKATRLELSKEPVEEPPPPEPEPEPPPEPVLPPSGYQCVEEDCRHTRQPGRAHCAEHLPKPKPRGGTASLTVSGASSMEW